MDYNMGVSKNNGTPKSSILIGFSIINHSFWGTPILETSIYSNVYQDLMCVFFLFVLLVWVNHCCNGDVENHRVGGSDYFFTKPREKKGIISLGSTGKSIQATLITIQLLLVDVF